MEKSVSIHNIKMVFTNKCVNFPLNVIKTKHRTFTIGFPLCGFFFTAWGTLLCYLYILLLSMSASGGLSLLQ